MQANLQDIKYKIPSEGKGAVPLQGLWTKQRDTPHKNIKHSLFWFFLTIYCINIPKPCSFIHTWHHKINHNYDISRILTQMPHVCIFNHTQLLPSSNCCTSIQQIVYSNIQLHTINLMKHTELNMTTGWIISKLERIWKCWWPLQNATHALPPKRTSPHKFSVWTRNYQSPLQSTRLLKWNPSIKSINLKFIPLRNLCVWHLWQLQLHVPLQSIFAFHHHQNSYTIWLAEFSQLDSG